MNTNEQGKITESIVLAHVLHLGYSVSIPFGDKDKYDQIWDINGKLLRVQIKTARINKKEKRPDKNKSIRFNCKSTVNNKTILYTNKDIDYFATYWNGIVYLISVDECNSSEKVLRFTSSQKQPNICWAADYELEKVIKNIINN